MNKQTKFYLRLLEDRDRVLYKLERDVKRMNKAEDQFHRDYWYNRCRRHVDIADVYSEIINDFLNS